MELKSTSRSFPESSVDILLHGFRSSCCFSSCLCLLASVGLFSGCLSSLNPFAEEKPKGSEASSIQAIPESPEDVAPVLEAAPTGVQEVVELSKPVSGELLAEEKEGFQFLFQTDVRSYRTSNVSRSRVDEDSAAITEYTLVGRLFFPATDALPSSFSLRPSLTLLAQRAYFGQYTIDSSDSTDDSLKALDYEFHSAILDSEISLPSQWKLALSLGYDELLEFREYDKLYHALTPSLSFGRDFRFSGNGLLNLEVSADYALTKTYRQYAVEGVFDDAGDNLRTAFSLSYAKPFGSTGRVYLTPSASIMRTAYTKPDAIGRVDYLAHAEVSAFVRIMPWLYLRAFGNYQDKMANDKAKSILGDYAEYENWEAGLGLGASFSF